MSRNRIVVSLLALHLVVGALVASVTPPKRLGDVHLPGLSSAFLAKELCSCLFVTGRSEAACKVYAHQSPQLATYSIDWNEKSVYASVAPVFGYGMYPHTAIYQGPKYGCVLH